MAAPHQNIADIVVLKTAAAEADHGDLNLDSDAPVGLKLAALRKAMAEAVFSQLGRLDGILHNAARFEGLIPLESQALEPWLNHLRVNLAAPIALTRACWPLRTDSCRSISRRRSGSPLSARSISHRASAAPSPSWARP